MTRRYLVVRAEILPYVPDAALAFLRAGIEKLFAGQGRGRRGSMTTFGEVTVEIRREEEIQAEIVSDAGR